MPLKSLTYTSLASLDLTSEDLDAVLRTARDLNALEGITGLLVFNGTRFMQIIEGPHAAIDDLVERLRRDRRHSGFEVRDERMIEERFFEDWSMELVRVKSRYQEARETLRKHLPETLPPAVGDRLFQMTAAISGDVEVS